MKGEKYVSNNLRCRALLYSCLDSRKDYATVIKTCKKEVVKVERRKYGDSRFYFKTRERREEKNKLRNYLHGYLRMSGCDGTLVGTEKWLDENIEDPDRREELLNYIEEHGGFCDCEVIFNVVG